MAFFVVKAVIAVGIFETAVLPAATYTNDNYVKPAVSYTTEKVSDGVDYVKEKIN